MTFAAARPENLRELPPNRAGDPILPDPRAGENLLY